MKPATCLHYGGLVSHVDKLRAFPLIFVSFAFSSPPNGQGGEP